MTEDNTTTAAANVLRRCLGYGRRQAEVALAAIGDDDRMAIAALENVPDCGPALRTLMDEIADRPGVVESGEWRVLITDHSRYAGTIHYFLHYPLTTNHYPLCPSSTTSRNKPIA